MSAASQPLRAIPQLNGSHSGPDECQQERTEDQDLHWVMNCSIYLLSHSQPTSFYYPKVIVNTKEGSALGDRWILMFEAYIGRNRPAVVVISHSLLERTQLANPAVFDTIQSLLREYERGELIRDVTSHGDDPNILITLIPFRGTQTL